MAKSVDPDQTAPIGAVCSGSTLIASILNSSVMLGNILQQTTQADNIFRRIFSCGFKGLVMKITIFIKTFLPLCVILNFQTMLKCRLKTFDIANTEASVTLKVAVPMIIQGGLSIALFSDLCWYRKSPKSGDYL